MNDFLLKEESNEEQKKKKKEKRKGKSVQDNGTTGVNSSPASNEPCGPKVMSLLNVTGLVRSNRDRHSLSHTDNRCVAALERDEQQHKVFSRKQSK